MSSIFRREHVSAIIVAIVAALSGSTCEAADESAREWNATSGGFRARATFVRQTSGRAVLRRADGVEMEVPLEQLIPADRDYIAARRKEANLALAAIPTPNAGDAHVVVTYSTENSQDQLIVGTVLLEDDRYRYIITSELREQRKSLHRAQDFATTRFTALVGNDAQMHRVALEKVSVVGDRLVLAAPKEKLPPPFRPATSGTLPKRGDRFRFIGFEFRGDHKGMDFARVTSEVVCEHDYIDIDINGINIDGNPSGKSVQFEVDPQSTTAAPVGVLVDAQGNAVALASGRSAVARHPKVVRLSDTIPMTSYHGYSPVDREKPLQVAMLCVDRSFDFSNVHELRCNIQMQIVDLSAHDKPKKLRLLCAEQHPDPMRRKGGIQVSDGAWVNRSDIDGFELDLVPAEQPDPKFTYALSQAEWPKMQNWTASIPFSFKLGDRDLMYRLVEVKADGKYAPYATDGGFGRIQLVVPEEVLRRARMEAR